MKIKYFTLLLAAFTIFISLTGCLKDSCKTNQTYVKYEPVYLSPEELRTDLVVEQPKKIELAGKFYYYKKHMFINEPFEGIHVIDNSDAAHPVQIAFWKLKGNIDIAIKDNILYVDQYVDMLTFDVTNLSQPKFLCRRNDVFRANAFDANLGYLIEYKRSTVTEEKDCNANTGEYFFEGDVLWTSINSSFDTRPGSISSIDLNASTGVAGSYTRFCFNDEFLYAIDNFSLRPFSLQGSACPLPQSEINVGWNIETIFPYKDHLFIGSQTGVFIYNATNGLRPTFASNFVHATGCDPVVCSDDLAFVTIHGGTTCRGNINQLDILDVKNLMAPVLIQSYAMKSPKGLALTANHIYLCDDGLKVLDRSNPVNMQVVAHLQNLMVTDAIALDNKHLLLIGDGGFYQYDISDPINPVEISKIEL